MTRAAYVEAFAAITGRPLVKLPQMAGRSESEIFFDALALNGADVSAGGTAESLLEPFSAALAAALQARRDDLVRDGQLLPGAAQALAAVAKLDGTGGADGADRAGRTDGSAAGRRGRTGWCRPC